MNQREYDSQEEKHMALADVTMSKMVNDYENDSTQVLMILSKVLQKMALGELDSITTDNFHSILDIAINAPFDKRHEPFNRFVTDALYAEAHNSAHAYEFLQIQEELT